MKIFAIALLALTLSATQAKFNLRSYAQHKLQKEADSEYHTHDSAVLSGNIATIVNSCFDAQLGKNNGALVNTVAVAEFDTQGAVNGINLCLQASNLRLSHAVDANITGNINVLKNKAKDLVDAQQKFATKVKEEASGLKSSMSSLESSVANAREQFQGVFESSDTDTPQEKVAALIEYLDNKDSSYGATHDSLKTAFAAFNELQTAAKGNLSSLLKAIKNATDNFDAARNDVSGNQAKIAEDIEAHYKEVPNDDETSDFPHPVSGSSGEGCGVLDASVTDGDLDEEKANEKMCADGLTCVSRKSQKLVDSVLNDDKGNLEYSGYFVCIDSTQLSYLTVGTDYDEATTSSDPINLDTSCSAPTTGPGEVASCNLYLLSGEA